MRHIELPKYDFKTVDNRVIDILLVRLDFVETWSAARTLSYYKSLREKTGRFYAKFYCCENQCFHLFDEPTSIKCKTDDSIRKAMETYETITRYHGMLKDILDKKGPAKNRIKKHKRAYLAR